MAHAIAISLRIYHKIRQKLFQAFGYNAIGIPLVALGLLNPLFVGADKAFRSISILRNA